MSSKLFRVVLVVLVGLFSFTALAPIAQAIPEKGTQRIHETPRDTEDDLEDTGLLGQGESVARNVGMKAWKGAQWFFFILFCLLSVAVALIPGAKAEGAVALVFGLVMLYFANKMFSGLDLAVLILGPVLCYIVPAIAALRGKAGRTRTDDFVFGAGKFAGVLVGYGLLVFLNWLSS